MERLKIAEAAETEEICRFYESVCAYQEGQEYGPVWHYGIYPDAEELEEHVRNGELLLLRRDGEIAAAMVVLGHEDEMYREVPWTVREEPIAVLHLFAVGEAFRGLGLGKTALRLLIERERGRGSRAIHLDVVKGNLPAERLYERMGFRYLEEREVWYEDTGDLRVALYEFDCKS